jgi:ribosomal protein S18 acetylase RimI-like enzyme
MLAQVERRPGLSSADLEELAQLERRAADVDGVRLKLEWQVLREGRDVEGLVERADGRMIAFLGVYSFDPAEAELVGLVDPEHRGRGIAGRLLDRALASCAERGLTRRLLVNPRASVAGAALATARGASLDHSEYSLMLTGEPERVAERPDVALREATSADRADLIRILTAGFGSPPESMMQDPVKRSTSRTLIIERAGAVVGTLRADLTADQGGVYGFAIDPEERGRGVGRDALGRVCADLRARGARRVKLEVEVDNEAALHLYTSTGFTPVGTEDYYLFPN